MSVKSFNIENLSSGYNKTKIIKDLDLEIPIGKISVILGSNGSGKSTLLKSMIRLIHPMQGVIKLDDQSIDKIPTKKLARTIGLLPQTQESITGITVYDVVARGRYPYQKAFSSLSEDDIRAIDYALEKMNIKEMATRNIEDLSGGQRQRVFIAMALAQETDILFLDEPTTYLDITYQIEILDLLTDLNREKNITVVMVLHDISIAARYADYLFIMKQGKLIKQGTPSEIINEDIIKEAFGLDCKVIQDPLSHTPLLILKSRHHMK